MAEKLESLVLRVVSVARDLVAVDAVHGTERCGLGSVKQAPARSFPRHRSVPDCHADIADVDNPGMRRAAGGNTVRGDAALRAGRLVRWTGTPSRGSVRIARATRLARLARSAERTILSGWSRPSETSVVSAYLQRLAMYRQRFAAMPGKRAGREMLAVTATRG